MSFEACSKVGPFSTLPSSEPVMRIGIGCLALSHILADEPAKTRGRFHITLDTPDEINRRLSGLPEVSFPPMAVVHVYYQKDTPVHPESQYILSIGDLFQDTVVFNLADRLPVEPDFATVFGHGVHERIATYLVISQGGRSHFFMCGGQKGEENIESLFRDYGKIGTLNFGEVMEDYALAKIDPKENVDADELEVRQKTYLNWMLANALVANLAFTQVAYHAQV